MTLPTADLRNPERKEFVVVAFGPESYGFVFPDGDDTWNFIVKFFEEHDRWMVVWQGEPTVDMGVAELSDDIEVFGPYDHDTAQAKAKSMVDTDRRGGRWACVPVTVP